VRKAELADDLRAGNLARVDPTLVVECMHGMAYIILAIFACRTATGDATLRGILR
jgi:hypothetical protein